MNELKQRVTNEKARADKDEHIFKGCGGADKSKIKDYAADLLDSRAIIEKQTGLLKEMRRELEDAKTVMEKYEAQLTGESFNYPSLNALLERTKDYA